MRKRNILIGITAAAAIAAASAAAAFASGDAGVCSALENRNALTGTADIVIWNVERDRKDKEQKVEVRIWSREDEEDLKVYEAREENGIYRVSFDSANHDEGAETFRMEICLTDEEGNRTPVKTDTLRMESMNVLVGVQAGKKNGTCRVFASGLPRVSDPDLQKVRVSVACTSDPKGREIWYECQADEDGYYAEFPLTSETRTGLYEASVWVTYRPGEEICVGSAPFQTEISQSAPQAVSMTNVGLNGELYQADPSSVRPDTTVSAEEGEEEVWTLSARNVPGMNGALEEVRFAVWNEADGQDDLRWYKAEYSEDAFRAMVPAAVHTDAGDFHADAWAFMEDGTGLFAGETDFTVDREWSLAIAMTDADPSLGTASLMICQNRSDYEISSVQAAIWSEEDKSDLAWYQAEDRQTGVYKIAFDRSQHQLMAEDFHAAVYMTDELGIRQNVREYLFHLDALEPVLNASQKGKGRYALLEAENVPGADTSLKEVLFTLYEDDGEGRFLGEYTGSLEDGRIRAEADLEEFGVAGKYRVEAVAVYKNGTKYQLGESAFEAVPIPFETAAGVLDEIGWNLQAAFRWSAALTYYGHNGIMPEDDSPGIEWFAEYGFKNKKGNCYVMASTFYEMAVDLGYEGRQIAGGVGMRAGGIGPHSWVELDLEDGTWVFDPNFTNESGGNGFKITYGQSGTWSYSMGHSMELKPTGEKAAETIRKAEAPDKKKSETDEEAPAEAEEAAKETVTEAEEAAEEAVTEAEEAAEETAAEAKDTAEETVTEMEEAAEEAVTEAEGAAEETVTEAEGAAEETVTEAEEA